MNRIKGTEGNDTLNGTVQTDLIRGFSGDDQLFDHLSGDDTVLGEAGNDYLSVQRTNEIEDNIRAEGGDGDDFILFNGYTTNASLIGGVGKDQIFVATGYDLTVAGGAGDDSLYLAGSIHSCRVAMGDGIDTTKIGSDFDNGARAATRLTFVNFQTGDAGDVLQLSEFLLQALTRWNTNHDPFRDGHLRLVDVKDSTGLQVNNDSRGDDWWTFGTFKGSHANEFTADNFAGFDPQSAAADMVV